MSSDRNRRIQLLKKIWKRCVFSLQRNCISEKNRVGVDWHWTQVNWKRVPNTRGSNRERLVAHVLVREWGEWRRSWNEERNSRQRRRIAIASIRYWGTTPIKQRNTRTAILNLIRCLIGSQWRLRSIGVMWSKWWAPEIKRAAEFCTRCSLSNSKLGRPTSKKIP